MKPERRDPALLYLIRRPRAKGRPRRRRGRQGRQRVAAIGSCDEHGIRVNLAGRCPTVGHGDPACGQDGLLLLPHPPALTNRPVVVPDEVEDPVDEEQGKLRPDITPARLSGGGLGRDDDIAQASG
jgi:hypothetical protein